MVLLRGDSREQVAFTKDASRPIDECVTEFAPELRIGSADERHPSGLARLIEAEVLPRLLLAHGAPEGGPAGDAQAAAAAGMTDRQMIENFARIVVDREIGAAMAEVRRLQQSGVPAEALLLGLLASTARHLGELWEEDRCSFVEVTIGLCRLHQIMLRLCRESDDDPACGPAELRILLAPTPGEQHTFGLAMVSEFFRRSAWEVSGGPGLTLDDLVEAVRAQHYAAVGLSLGSCAMVDVLARTVAAVRAASANRRVGIIVGGAAFKISPDFVERVGADAAAADAHEAVLAAIRICARLSMPA